MLALAISLTLCASSLDGEARQLLVLPPPPTLGVAPQLPQLSEDLPIAVRVPGGTCLPSPLDVALNAWIVYVHRLPGLCQAGLDELGRYKDIERMAAVDVARAQEQARATEQLVVSVLERGWPTWQVVLFVGASVVLAGGAGYLAGKLSD